MSRDIEVSEEFELQVSGVENVAAELCTTGIILVGTEHATGVDLACEDVTEVFIGESKSAVEFTSFEVEGVCWFGISQR